MNATARDSDSDLASTCAEVRLKIPHEIMAGFRTETPVRYELPYVARAGPVPSLWRSRSKALWLKVHGSWP